MYPCTVALAPPSPTILAGDVMKFSINGGLFIECRIRIGIIEKVTPVSIMADLITESDSTTSAKSWEAPRPAELTAAIVYDCVELLCLALLGNDGSVVCEWKRWRTIVTTRAWVRVSGCRKGGSGTIGRRLLRCGARHVLR